MATEKQRHFNEYRGIFQSNSRYPQFCTQISLLFSFSFSLSRFHSFFVYIRNEKKTNKNFFFSWNESSTWAGQRNNNNEGAPRKMVRWCYDRTTRTGSVYNFNSNKELKKGNLQMRTQFKNPIHTDTHTRSMFWSKFQLIASTQYTTHKHRGRECCLFVEFLAVCMFESAQKSEW